MSFISRVCALAAVGVLAIPAAVAVSGTFVPGNITGPGSLQVAPFVIASDLGSGPASTTIAGVGTFNDDAGGHFSGAGYGDYSGGAPVSLGDANLDSILQTQRYKQTMTASIPVSPGQNYTFQMLFYEPGGLAATRTMAITAEADTLPAFSIVGLGSTTSKLDYIFLAGDSSLDISLSYPADNATLSGYSLKQTAAVVGGAFSSTAITGAFDLTTGPHVIASDLGNAPATNTIPGVGTFTDDAGGHFSGAGYGDYDGGAPVNVGNANLNSLLQSQRYKPTMSASIPVTPGDTYRMEMLFYDPGGVGSTRTMTIQAEGDTTTYNIASHGTPTSRLDYDFVAGDSALDISLAFPSDNATLSGYTLRNLTANPLVRGTFTGRALNGPGDLTPGPYIIASDLGNGPASTTIAGVGTFTDDVGGYAPGSDYTGGAPATTSDADLNSILNSTRYNPGLSSLSIPVEVGKHYLLELLLHDPGGPGSTRTMNVFAENDQTGYRITTFGSASSILDYEFIAQDTSLNFRLEFLSDNATISAFMLKEIVAVPEPSGLAAISFATLGLLGAVRRRGH